MIDDATLLARFLDGSADPAEFHHVEHVRVTFLLLRTRPLPETMIALREGLIRIATKVGRPERYHETITFAFAVLIDERMRKHPNQGWDAFAIENGDLLSWRDGAILKRYYDSERMRSDEALRSFLFPAPPGS